ncbi:uncharacterized protein LOC123554156 [Mercenaria mercenaria]|uniref:uncharacterized protein LOC123554156 n=1 Tax=Mercenaria mercenaria TaxID=6596 RepID=UPI00234F0641|nr:uncharacterized protein LOC123554156 [Mercenaria mercenaria]
MDYLKVPDNKQNETSNLEKPLITQGKFSGISMIPEEEPENYSEDEISIDVPDGSSVSSVILYGSVESHPTGRVCSIYSSTETLNEKDIETTTDDGNSACSEQSHYESSETENETINDKHMNVENNEYVSAVRKHVMAEGDVNGEADIQKQQINKQSFKTVDANKETFIEETINEKDVIYQNSQEKQSNKSDAIQIENENIKAESNKDEYSDDHALFDINSRSNDSDTHDGCENAERIHSVSSNGSKRTESSEGISRDSFSDDHWEEISIDDDVLNEMIENIKEADAGKGIQVSKENTWELTRKPITGSSREELSQSREISEYGAEIEVNGKNADSVSFKSLKNTDNSENFTNMSTLSKSMPCILITQDSDDVKTERNIDSNVCDMKECKGVKEGTDRDVSVSNVVLDSKSVSVTPTIEFRIDNDENIQDNIEIQSDAMNESVHFRENVMQPIFLTKFNNHAEKEINSGENTDEFTTTADISETSEGRGLSPNSDLEYDYNKRRGSQVKIKLEGRRRQRLSISESEPPKSPTDLKYSDDERNDDNVVVPRCGPLLNKREKMEKLSFSDRSENQDSVSPIREMTINTIVDISDTNTVKMQPSSQTDISKSSKNSNSRKIENINSLNDELLAIFNSSAPLESRQQLYRQPSNSMQSQPKQNEEDYFKGYNLLKSCNQAHTTQSFVTDINQMIVKTRKQSECDTGRSQQDFNYDTASNKSNRDNIDDNKNNCKPKSHLLPNRNETGNCQIKASEKSAIEHDTLSHKCEQKQLSLRQNGNKNNEINEPASSIEQLPSQNKQYKIKSLRKRQAYDDLFERESHSVSPVWKPPPAQIHLETTVTRDVRARNHSLVPPKSDLRLKTSKVCSKQGTSEKVSLQTCFSSAKVYSQHNVKNSKLEKSKAESGNFEMSARIHRSRDEQMEIAGFADREMSARLRRTQSSLTDTARLKSIRKLLKLTDENEDKTEQNTDEETKLIIQGIIEGIVSNVCSHRMRTFQKAMETHRCTTTDDNGDELLCCLFQTSCSNVDPSNFECDVIDPVDVCPITRKHEHLISNIVRISSTVFKKFSPKDELMVNIPIAHWYVEKWQELVIRQQDHNGQWKDADRYTADIVKIDDINKVYYGVRHILSEPCTLAVVTRPRMTSVAMAAHNLEVNSVIDDRVKMHVFSSLEQKSVNMQVVPVNDSVLAEFCGKEENKKACVIVSSSPLVQICIDGDQPESLAFDVPYVSVSPRRPDIKTSASRSSSQSLLSPYLSPVQSPRRLSVASPFVTDSNKRAFHLAQIGEDEEVKVKLLGNNDSKTIDIVTGQIEENHETDEQAVRFSVYEKSARLISLETKGSLKYSDVENVTKSFVNFIVKHKVMLSISQDPRNVYSILFTAMVDHPHREKNHTANQAYKYFTTSYRKELQIYEGDVVAISFRGNVDIPDREQLIYSFHGCRGIRKHFDIQVSNPMSQRSLQSYHGALQFFTLKTPRYSGLDRSLAPCAKNGWELTAEFPLLLPKYLKSTPVIINKAPVSLRFHEPLTVDFIRTICSELVNEWTQFAKALGISHARVQAIKQQHRNQVSDKVLMDVIINWMKTQRISQDKVTPLINALRICNRHKLASELAHRLSAQKVNRSKTTRDKSLQKAFSVISKSSSVIAKWRQLLHHLCQDDGNQVIDVTKEIDEKYNDEVTKCQSALLHWKTTAPAPSVWTLVDALRANRCNIVADTIVTMEAKRK